MTSYYDNTRISAYKDCPRMFFFRHILHWRREGLSKDLAFGLAWHDAMDQVWAGINEGEPPALVMDNAVQAFNDTWAEQGMTPAQDLTIDEISALGTKTPGIGAEMIWNYMTERNNFLRSIELLEVEQPFVVPLYLDDDSVLYCGRRDKVFKLDGQVICGEHKTTGSYKLGGPFRADYLESWALNSQVDGYQHSLHMTYPGNHIGGVWVDAALCHKKIHDGFRFIPVSKSPLLLDAWLRDTRIWIDRIEREKQQWRDQCLMDPMHCFPKNTNACDKWRGCGYRYICKYVDAPHQLDEVPEGFMVEKWSPFDKLGLAKLGLEEETDA